MYIFQYNLTIQIDLQFNAYDGMLDLYIGYQNQSAIIKKN